MFCIKHLSTVGVGPLSKLQLIRSGVWFLSIQDPNINVSWITDSLHKELFTNVNNWSLDMTVKQSPFKS